jgi:hypothetical protein
MTKEKKHVKFYADHPMKGIKNKLHCYYVNNSTDAKRAIVRFERIGYKIRAAWYVENNVSNRIFLTCKNQQS